ncbi:MAG: heat-shock protein HtpX, partial [Gammaproteobacteria bacterium]|nr:heat-shock protein HtpX [Gammaproteobacteria bacterium]
ALLLDPGQEIRDRQLAHLQAHADPGVFELLGEISPQMDGLDIGFRLPLIDLAITALKQLSHDQYRAFRDNLLALIEMDARVGLMEWTLQKILFNHLDGQFFKLTHARRRYSSVGRLGREIELLLSVVAHAGHPEQDNVRAAFDAAANSLGIDGLRLIEKSKINLADLDRSLQKLQSLKPSAKPRILMACAASVVNDQIISAHEVELLRAFSDVLECPLPPIIPPRSN